MKDFFEALGLAIVVFVMVALYFLFSGTPSLFSVFREQAVKSAQEQSCAKQN